MNIRIHPHAAERVLERGTTEAEVIETVEFGERFPAKFGRTGYRRNFIFDREWKGRHYYTKQVEAYGVEEQKGWLVITVIVRYF